MEKTTRSRRRTRTSNNETKEFKRDNLLERLFRGRDGYLELRAVRDGSKPITKHLSLKDGWSINCRLVDGFCDKHKDYNLYFGVATRDGKGGKKENVVNIPCVWADIDYKDISRDKFNEKLKQFPFNPTVKILSGGGLHLYWILDQRAEQANGEDIEKVNDWIASELGGDNVKDIARVMRLPGTANHKYETKPLCTVKEINSNTYTLDKFLEKVPKKKNITRKRSPARKLPLDILEEQIKYISNQIKENEVIISEEDTYKDWLNIGFALIDGLGEEGRKYFHIVSSVSPKYVERETDEQYDACLKSDEKTSRTKKTPIEYFINLAKKANIRTHKGLRNDRRFNKNGTGIFDPLLESRIFIEDGDKSFIIYNKQLLMYHEGYYQFFVNEYYLKLIEGQIEFFLNGRVAKAREILDISKHQHTEMKEPEVNVNPKLLNVRNGLLDSDTMELQPHTPDIIYTYQIPINYNPDARCRRWKQFLKEVLVTEDDFKLDNELSRIVKRFIGYCLYARIPFHECIMFYGDGRNGKSVITKVVGKLFEGSISQVHFEEIGENRFATSDLSGKLVNISQEFGSSARLADGRVKGIIAGDTIRAERKGQDAFDFKPFCKHIITTNNLPRSKDKSLGFFSRFIIVPFHREFVSKEEFENREDEAISGRCLVRNEFLEDELKEELEGIFLWALGGLKRLLDEKEFPHSEQVMKYKNIFKVYCSAVETFVDEKVDRSDNVYDQTETLQDLYKAFLEYCKENKIPSISNRKFSEQLTNLGLEKSVGTNNVRIVKGCKLIY